MFAVTAVILVPLNVAFCTWIMREWDGSIAGKGARIESRLQRMRSNRFMKHPVAILPVVGRTCTLRRGVGSGGPLLSQQPAGLGGGHGRHDQGGDAIGPPPPQGGVQHESRESDDR